jgi:hypothetical protein
LQSASDPQGAIQVALDQCIARIKLVRLLEQRNRSVDGASVQLF